MSVRKRLAQDRQRRRRRVVTVLLAAAVLVVAGLIGWGVYAAQRPASAATPPGATTDGTGFARGTGPVQVEIYEDFLCPACRQFEQLTDTTLDELVDGGKVTVIYRPIAILDRQSTTAYSTRSAAAAAAAAGSENFVAYHDALFAQQPAEGSAGLSDDQLVQIGRTVGLTDRAFASAVSDGTYRSWAVRATEAASAHGVVGTPTVKVAGTTLDRPTPDALRAAVAAAGL